MEGEERKMGGQVRRSHWVPGTPNNLYSSKVLQLTISFGNKFNEWSIVTFNRLTSNLLLHLEVIKHSLPLQFPSPTEPVDPPPPQVSTIRL